MQLQLCLVGSVLSGPIQVTSEARRKTLHAGLSNGLQPCPWAMVQQQCWCSMYVNICMDELFAESVFTACCMLLWHLNAAVSDLYASPRQTASINCLQCLSVRA